MSSYGKQVINQLIINNYELIIKEFEIVTIKVSGCNGEVIRVCQKNNIELKIFRGDNFEKLNEEVAEYADCLVIVEGGKKSGTMLLAEKFVEKNKLVYAVPGRITDEGSWTPNWLIEQGAIPVIDIDIIG